MSDVRRTVTHMSETNPLSSAIPAWTLGWRLQRALAHAGISVQGMANELDVSRSTISRWINDNGTPPRSGFVKLWALRTGVPYEWLAEGVERPDTDPTQGTRKNAWFTGDSDLDGTVVPLFPSVHSDEVWAA